MIGDTALHYAAIGAKSEPILALVNKGMMAAWQCKSFKNPKNTFVGADVNYQNNDKRTALHIAVLNRNLDIVGTLVKVKLGFSFQWTLVEFWFFYFCSGWSWCKHSRCQWWYSFSNCCHSRLEFFLLLLIQCAIQ